jgi:hypothetical protein
LLTIGTQCGSLSQEKKMEKYKDLISAVLATARELAKFTDSTVDDSVVSAVELLFARYFGLAGSPPVMHAAICTASTVHADAQAAGIPAWMIPIVTAVLRALLGL